MWPTTTTKTTTSPSLLPLLLLLLLFIFHFIPLVQSYSQCVVNQAMNPYAAALSKFRTSVQLSHVTIAPRSMLNITCLTKNDFRHKYELSIQYDQPSSRIEGAYILDQNLNLMSGKYYRIVGASPSVSGSFKVKRNRFVVFVVSNSEDVPVSLALKLNFRTGLSNWAYVMCWIGGIVGALVLVVNLPNILQAVFELFRCVWLLVSYIFNGITYLYQFGRNLLLSSYSQLNDIDSELGLHSMLDEPLEYSLQDLPPGCVIHILDYLTLAVENPSKWTAQSQNKQVLERYMMGQLFGKFVRNDVGCDIDRPLLLYSTIDFTLVHLTLLSIPHTLRLREVKSMSILYWYSKSWSTKYYNPNLKEVRITNFSYLSADQVQEFIEAAQHLNVLETFVSTSGVLPYLLNLKKISWNSLSLEDATALAHLPNKLTKITINNIEPIVFSMITQIPSVESFDLSVRDLPKSAWDNVDFTVEKSFRFREVYSTLAHTVYVPLYRYYLRNVELSGNTFLAPESFDDESAPNSQSHLKSLRVENEMPAQFFYNLSRFTDLKELFISVAPPMFCFLKLLHALPSLEKLKIELRPETIEKYPSVPLTFKLQRNDMLELRNKCRKLTYVCFLGAVEFSNTGSGWEENILEQSPFINNA